MVNVTDDLTGQKFGKLTVLHQTDDYVYPNGKRRAQWVCECGCKQHNIVIVRHDYLKNFHTQSCGCLQKEKVSEAVKQYNQYNLDGEFGIGWTSNTHDEFYFDLEDYDVIKDVCWFLSVTRNTRRLEGRHPDTGKMVRMHVWLGYKNYDHIDRNELNNRKENLRPATKKENSRNHSLFQNNTSGFSGVGWDKSRNKWYARIEIDGSTKSLGRFVNKKDAIIARLKAEARYYGKFAPQRHLFEQYGIENELLEGEYGNN